MGKSNFSFEHKTRPLVKLSVKHKSIYCIINNLSNGHLQQSNVIRISRLKSRLVVTWMENYLCYRQHLPDHGYDCCKHDPDDMPMTNLVQCLLIGLLIGRGLLAPETFCPLLPGDLTMVVIMLILKFWLVITVTYHNHNDDLHHHHQQCLPDEVGGCVNHQ